MKKRLSFVLTMLLLSTPLLGEEKVYSVRMKEVFVGKVIFNHQFEEGRYHVNLVAETVGFAKALVLASLDGEAEGTGEEYRQYHPERSTIDIRTPQFQEETKLQFSENHISDYSNSNNKPAQIDFADHEDVIDPVTAFAYLARPTPYDKICALRVLVSDGQKLYRLVLRDPELRSDGRRQCKGGLERLEGFSDQELEERAHYEFTAVYRQDTESEYRLDWLVTDSPYGTLDLAFHY